MKLFALKSIKDSGGNVLGQKSLNVEVPKIVIELLTSEKISENEFEIIKLAVGSVDYIAVDNTFYQMKLIEESLPRIDAQKFTAEKGVFHIFTEEELSKKYDKFKGGKKNVKRKETCEIF